MAGAESVLEVRDLDVGFHSRAGYVHALRGIRLSVPKGAIVGVVGESGSGKSTLGLAVMGLLAYNADIAGGSANFAGRDLLKLSKEDMRDLRGPSIAMVFQDPMTALNPVRSIGQQMTDIQFRDRTRSMAQKRQVASAMLRKVGMPDPERQLDRYPHQFSGGMRQRIAIAMGLLQSPALLIADEPTTALDVTLEAQILHLLRKLSREMGSSILFISHNLGAVAEICDLVVVLYAGEVVESASVREIFRDPRHPYTRALLDCDPARIEIADRRELPTIPGDVPNLVEIPAGCVFAPRCSRVIERCRGERPQEIMVGGEHGARCFLAEAGERA
jgi:peptide/nickel transport system ATP-binding protein